MAYTFVFNYFDLLTKIYEQGDLESTVQGLEQGVENCYLQFHSRPPAHVSEFERKVDYRMANYSMVHHIRVWLPETGKFD